MSKQYETVFIMTPVLSDDQMRETVGKFENFLKEYGAKVVHQENWGLRKLAYPINKKTTGFYHLFEYTAEAGDVVQKLEVEFIRDERILRFLTVSLDKYAIAYAEKRRKEGFGKKARAEKKAAAETTKAAEVSKAAEDKAAADTKAAADNIKQEPVNEQ